MTIFKANKYIFLLFLFIMFSNCLLLGQNNTLLLLNGKKIDLFSYRIIEEEEDTIITYTTIKRRSGTKYFDKVFSLTDSKGQEKVFYYPNPEFDEDLSISQMRSFVKGRSLGNDLKISPFVCIGSFALGFGSVFIPAPSLTIGGTSLSIPVGMLLPVANTVSFSNLYTPPKKMAMKVPEANKSDEYFVMGVEESLRKKRVKNSLIGGVLGFVAGMITIIAIQ